MPTHDVDDVRLPVVLCRLPDVVDAVPCSVAIPLEDKLNRGHDVVDVDRRPPELLAEGLQDRDRPIGSA